MTVSFVYKFKSVSIESVPNDVSVVIDGYLADSLGNPFIDPDTGAVDSFDTSFLKSKLPASGYDSFLSIQVGRSLKDKYNKSKGGALLSGSSNISEIEDTSDLVPGLGVTGLGVPIDTILESIKSPNSIKLSAAVTQSGQTTLVFSASGWAIDFSEIDRIIDVVNFGSL